MRPNPPRSLSRQGGAVSVAAALLVILMLSSLVVALLVNTGSFISDTQASEKSSAALSLAESGMERAQGVVSRAVQNGSYSNATCTALPSAGSLVLGRGTFSYESAQSVPALCSDAGTPCTECRFVTVGQIDGIQRRIRTAVSISQTTGVRGHASSFLLELRSQLDGAAAFTNLAYRATATQVGDVSSNAKVSSCTNTGGSCDIANFGWDLQRTGTNNVSNMAVFSQVPLSGTYTISNALGTNGGLAAARDYAMTGMLLYPASGSSSISFVGQYASATGTNPTASASQTTGTLPTGWTCNAGSSTVANMSRAATADTLVFGFGSKPVSAASILDGVTLGVHPLKRIISLSSSQGDAIYSQMWYSWNAPFSTTALATSSGKVLSFSSAAVAPQAGTTLAVQAGTGAFDRSDFVGSIAGNVLTVSSLTRGNLNAGDALYGPSVNLPSRIDAQLSGATGGVGTYRVCHVRSDNSCAPQEVPSSTMTARVGVVAQLTSNSWSLSRAPSTALANATVCGGVCAFFFGDTGANTAYSLRSITAGDDWASGFACLKGVDPTSARVLGITDLKRAFWAEPVF